MHFLKHFFPWAAGLSDLSESQLCVVWNMELDFWINKIQDRTQSWRSLLFKVFYCLSNLLMYILICKFIKKLEKKLSKQKKKKKKRKLKALILLNQTCTEKQMCAATLRHRIFFFFSLRTWSFCEPDLSKITKKYCWLCTSLTALFTSETCSGFIRIDRNAPFQTRWRMEGHPIGQVITGTLL